MALKTAETAGLKASSKAFGEITSFYDNITDAKSGQVGYTELGSVAIKSTEAALKNLSIKPSLTAIGVLIRFFNNPYDPMIQKGVDVIMADLPAWDKSKVGGIDYYYWFYGSYSLYRFDGPKGPCWKKWEERIRSILVKNQRPKKDGCLWGSWDPIDRWGDEGGRVYATAINTLTLEVYYRGSPGSK
jgi:hypothetical protein